MELKLSFITSYTNPPNPKNVIAINPIVINAIGTPLKLSGIFLFNAILSLIAANKVIAKMKPSEAPIALANVSIKLYFSFYVC